MLVPLLLMNAAGFGIMLLDKNLAACFGSAGVLAGMLIGHHKTRKPLFTVTVPVLLLAQGAGLYLLFGH